MDTELVFASLQATGIVILGLFSLVMADMTLKRKISRRRFAEAFAGFILVSFFVCLPFRYCVAINFMSVNDTYIISGVLSTPVAAAIEAAAILLVTLLVHAFVIYAYSGKISSKIFTASFTSLISLMVCSFFSDYAVFLLDLSAGFETNTAEYLIFYLIVQTILAAAASVIYFLLIRHSAVKLISDTNGDMQKFTAVPIVCYILFVLNYCAWYAVPYLFESEMRFQYTLISIILPILYIVIFRLIFKEIANAAEHMRSETEMNSARLIQSSVLPPAKSYAAAGVNISSMIVPAKEVGGDFYDFFNLDNDRIALVIADVSGKGVPAALFMMRAHTLIKSNLMACQSPAEALTKANLELLECNDSCMFVTVFAGILHLNTGRLEYSSAGHNPPLVKNTVSGYLSVKKAPVLGVAPVRYENAETMLNKDSVLLLYTDGVTEAMDENNELYGEKRLAALADRAGILNVADLIQIVYSDVQKFSKQPNDDITMVALEYTAGYTKMTMPADTAYFKEVQSALDALNIQNNKLKSELFIIADEIFTNISHYAYPNSEGKINIIMHCTEDCLELRFEDRGIQFNPLEIEDLDASLPLKERRIGGYGIHMVKNLADHISYEYAGGKNILTIQKNLA